MSMSAEPEVVLWGPIVDRIRCPRCGSAVTAVPVGVRCESGHEFVMHSGYLDFSSEARPGGTTEQTMSSFGYEWNAFDDIRDEDEAFAAIYFADLDLPGLAGKVGLDAGCGKGRFTRILARYLDGIVALDGSQAVEAAARNLGDQDHVVVVRSDLRSAPFGPESFDFICSLGVLHHLDNPREGFRRLIDHLAPGGQLLLYLYSRPGTTDVRAVALRLATLVRKVTVRLPHRLLKVLSEPIAALLYGGVVLPGRWGQRRGLAALDALPMTTYRDKPFRSLVLDTFDRLSAPVEHRYVWAELEPWFDEAGLVVDAARDQTGWFITAHRPLGVT